MHLRRADDHYFARLVSRAEDGGFWTLHTMGVEPPNAKTATVLEHKADGFVCRGAWRTMCPFCGGSQFANPGTQSRFMCCDCGNLAVNGWVGVQWPDDLDEIERALLLRRSPENMNWYPHEAVEHLYAENIEHGLIELGQVPKARRPLVKLLVEAGRDIEPAHFIAPGTIVHPDSEWYPKLHAEIVKTLGKNVSESDIKRALMIHASSNRGGWTP